MALPFGFEFIVNDQVPRQPGLRWLNGRALKVHAEVYAQLEKLFSAEAYAGQSRCIRE
jgi:hypothetical protein